MTGDLNFVDINFFIAINMYQFKKFDFIIFLILKLNIQLNEQILWTYAIQFCLQILW